jgi:glycosyltransferase involved in cell wall biosynthesis
MDAVSALDRGLSLAQPDHGLPKFAVVITHHNYSELVEGALLSVLSQTHSDFECVVVDDGSDRRHYEAAAAIVTSLKDARFSFLRNKENLGQVAAFFSGLNATSADFIAILDPDDRYRPHFMERMLQVHLNPVTFAPVACCEQQLLKHGTGVVTGPFSEHNFEQYKERKLDSAEAHTTRYGFTAYFPAEQVKRTWVSTSSWVYRRDAVRLIEPRRQLQYKRAADSYLANGVHMMGGTLYLNEPLVYRGLHQGNRYINNQYFSTYQKRRRVVSEDWSRQCALDAVEAFFANEGDRFFSEEGILPILQLYLDPGEIVQLAEVSPRFKALILKTSRHFQETETRNRELAARKPA